MILEYSVTTSNGPVETLNHIQYNPATYAKGKYAYVFQGQRNGFQYPSWNGFEETILGPIIQYSHHKKNLIQIIYSDHHLTIPCGKSLNEVFMLRILVVA